MILGSGLLQSNWPRASDWLVRDEFTDTLAAGSVNGTAATPGPGTRTVTDTDSDAVSVGSGVLTIVNPNSSYGDPGIYYALQTRAAGLGLIAKAQFTAAATGGIGFSSASPGGPTAAGIDFSGGTFRFYPGTVSVGSADQSQYYEFAVVLRSAGSFGFVKGGTFANWTLLYMSSTGTGNAYPMIGTFSVPISTDHFRVVQLPAPFDTDDGLATDVLSGSVSAGTTFEHTANCLIEFTVDTVPSTAIFIDFRRIDDDNRWYAYVNSSGNFALYERVGGVPVQRAVTAGPVTNGHRVVIIADGTTIKGYYNNTLAWAYSSATNFATATAGEVFALGTGGAVSNLKTWPREMDGIAASILNKVSA